MLEPLKRNTAPAILAATLDNDIQEKQPIIFLSSDHLIENKKKFIYEIKKNKNKLSNKNIFIFGIKPSFPSSQFGYFLSKKNKNINQVKNFIEKPNIIKAKKIIKQGAFWNSGMFFLRKDSIINNFKKFEKKIYQSTLNAFKKAKIKNNIYYLNKKAFTRNPIKSFDHAILEKTKDINAIKLNIKWSDLGSWREILIMFNNNKSKYFKKKNTFNRPWGKYTNLFKGNKFLIKELYIKKNGILSLQKHFHRSEHWVITQGVAKITLNKKNFYKKPYETIFIPQGSIHRIQNQNQKPVKILEAQLGSILKETDIVRFEDVYGRVN